MVRIILSFDDGSTFDLKVAHMLEKYGFRGLFYIPTCCEITEEQIRELSTTHHIGGHSTTHPEDIKTYSYEMAYVDILENKLWLEGIISRKIRTFAYPSGKHDDSTIRAVEAAGYSDARTVAVGSVTKADNPYRTDTSVHIYPHRKEYNGKTWNQFAREMLKKAIDENGIFHIWGHGKEIEKFNLWGQFEEFLQHLAEVWSTENTKRTTDDIIDVNKVNHDSKKPKNTKRSGKRNTKKNS